MSALQKLEEHVRQLYESMPDGRDEWSDWMYEHHVFVVADFAQAVARRMGADVELSRAAAMLHDIADAVMKRTDGGHEQESERIARELLGQCGFGKSDIATVVDDALRFHSCHGDERPATLEGKVLATADALAHLKTDFYLYGVWFKGGSVPFADLKARVLQKSKRDFYSKILFDDIRAETQPDFDAIQDLFSR